MAHPLLELKKHLSPKEIKERYLKCKKGVERTHWQILWLVGRKVNALKPSEAAEVTGVSPDWVRKLMRRYNKEGADGIFDKRKENGKDLILSKEDQEELKKKLMGKADDGGLWTGPKVAQWISKKVKRRVHEVTGWRYLKRLGFSLKMPRPEHQKTATPEEQKDFKKNSKKKLKLSKKKTQQSK